MNNNKKILVVGDVHGEFEVFIKGISKLIKKHGKFEYIIQLGDFGFWPNYKTISDKFYIIKDYFTKIQIPLLWIDGNHEDHSVLQYVDIFEKSIWNRFGSNVFYKKRGSYIELEDKILLFIGGALSVDKLHRTETIDVFIEEEVTRSQSHEILETVEKLNKIKKPKIVFSHCAPYIEKTKFPIRIMDKAVSWQNKFLYEVLKDLKPEKWFHGHYHIDQDYALKGFKTSFYALDLVDNRESFGHRVLEV